MKAAEALVAEFQEYLTSSEDLVSAAYVALSGSMSLLLSIDPVLGNQVIDLYQEINEASVQAPEGQKLRVALAHPHLKECQLLAQVLRRKLQEANEGPGELH